MVFAELPSHSFSSQAVFSLHHARKAGDGGSAKLAKGVSPSWCLTLCFRSAMR